VRLARLLATTASLLGTLAIVTIAASTLGRIELVRAARETRAIADQVETQMRSAGASIDQAIANSGALPIPTAASRLGVDSTRLAREDRVLVVGRGLTRTVTQPIKDADDWDVIAIAAVTVAPFTRVTAAAVDIAVGALLATVGILLSLGAGRRGIFGASAGTAAAGTAWLANILQREIQLAGPATGSVIADPTTLPVPSAASTNALLVLSLVATVALWLASAWIASPRRRAAEVRQTVAAWSFLAPSFVHVLLFSLGPLAFTLWVSFHRWDLLTADKPFVGFANYREMVSDPLFWRALRNTAIYALNVPVTMLVALGAALVLQRGHRGVRVLRAIVFLPYVVSYVAIAMVWQWIYNVDFGLLNYALRLIGIPPVDWLGDPRTALSAVMLVAVWVQLGFHMIVYLAGLQGIPEHLHEAARLDGASRWQRFRWITVPLLRPVSVYLFVTGIIWSFQVFTLVYVMTEGGPVHATDVVVYQIYQQAWEFRRMGYASAMSWFLFALLLVLTLAQWKVLDRKVEHA
jgi:multiple sugar transport system permease protein